MCHSCQGESFAADVPANCMKTGYVLFCLNVIVAPQQPQQSDLQWVPIFAGQRRFVPDQLSINAKAAAGAAAEGGQAYQVYQTTDAAG